jgi:hypothetical protein
MPRTILWLGAVICVGWSCSDACAFGLIARLRNGQGTVISADTPAPPGTTIVNGRIISGNGQITNGNGQIINGNGQINGTINGEVSADCAGGHHGLCGGHLGGGHLGGLGGKLEAAKGRINAWLLDVPQKQAPAPPPPAPAHPWVRSPRDYFMVGDP